MNILISNILLSLFLLIFLLDVSLVFFPYIDIVVCFCSVFFYWAILDRLFHIEFRSTLFEVIFYMIRHSNNSILIFPFPMFNSSTSNSDSPLVLPSKRSKIKLEH
jgi:hypothetical protein